MSQKALAVCFYIIMYLFVYLFFCLLFLLVHLLSYIVIYRISTPGLYMMGSVVALWTAEPIICIPDVTTGLPPCVTMLLKITLQLTC